jgi:hypothetical protein
VVSVIIGLHDGIWQQQMKSIFLKTEQFESAQSTLE